MGRPGLSLDRKFKRLARALDDVQAGFGEMLARGALELLWDSAYEACDDFVGDVDDVEAQAHWRGKRGTLTTALVLAGGEGRCGFLEEGGSGWWPEGRAGTYRIHDLWDHAPEYAAKRAAREAEREAAGTTISQIRAAAGKKGRKTQLEAKRPNGEQMVPLAEQAADNRQTDGGQTDAVCLGGEAEPRANGVPPSPTPTPAPTPEGEAFPSRLNPRADGEADRLAMPPAENLDALPATAAVLRALHAAGKAAAAPAREPRTRRRDEELIASAGVETATARILAAWNPARTTLGWYSDAITGAASKPARDPKRGMATPSTDFTSPEATTL